MYKKILVPLDGSELAECVIPHLETLAKGCEINTIVFVRVVDPSVPPSTYPTSAEFGLLKEDRDKLVAHRKQVAEKYLKQLVEKLDYGWAELEWEVLVGRAAESIADYTQQNAVDIVLIASHGRSGISRWMLGSVADRILRSICVPVMMVRVPGCVRNLI
jgi:nucleotide-binding universal stress UspA family protein